MKPKISIIGRGNVASHLYKALREKADTTIVNPRTLANLPDKSDIILISVSDDAISQIVNQLPHTNAIVAHTSGSVPMSDLSCLGSHIGVLYPLQTFTKDVDLNYSEIPVFIEGSSPDVLSSLKIIASLFSDDVREASSEERKKLHLASVFTCNFTNCLAGIGEKILEGSNISFSVMLPILRQTVKKLERMSAKQAQTGPAKRGDQKVMKSHLEMLSSEPELKKLYNLMSELIIKS